MRIGAKGGAEVCGVGRGCFDLGGEVKGAETSPFLEARDRRRGAPKGFVVGAVGEGGRGIKRWAGGEPIFEGERGGPSWWMEWEEASDSNTGRTSLTLDVTDSLRRCPGRGEGARSELCDARCGAKWDESERVGLSGRREGGHSQGVAEASDAAAGKP